MSITTVNVLCTAYLQHAGVFAGRIRAKLNNMYATTSGVVLPDTVHSVKFTNGTATLVLIPNSQFVNSTGSYYTITLEERTSITDNYNTVDEYKPVRTTHIIVPDSDCNLSDIVALPPTREAPAIAQAFASKAATSATAAAQSASQAASAISTHNTSTTAHQDIRALIVSSGLPEQTGHAGEYLKTDGTDPSWSEVNALPTQSSETSGKFLKSGDGTTEASWDTVDVSGAISTHNFDTTAHSDIRTAVASILPSQTGHSGKVLGTDGSATLWVPVSTMSTVTDTTSTMIALSTAAANTNYTYGQLSSLAVGFSASSTANDEIHIMFKSGTTATTLTVDGTNALFSSFTPNASSVVEIDARYYSHLSKWIVLFSQVAIS